MVQQVNSRVFRLCLVAGIKHVTRLVSLAYHIGVPSVSNQALQKEPEITDPFTTEGYGIAQTRVV